MFTAKPPGHPITHSHSDFDESLAACQHQGETISIELGSGRGASQRGAAAAEAAGRRGGGLARLDRPAAVGKSAPMIQLHETAWRAEVRAAVPAEPITSQDVDILHSRLPGFPATHHDANQGKLTLWFRPDGDTLRAATSAALDAAHGTIAAVYGEAAAMTQIRVIPEADFAAELGVSAVPS